MDKIFTTHVSLVDGKVHILRMNLDSFLDKVVASDGSFKNSLICFDDILINPEHIVSVQQVVAVKPGRTRSTVY
ncbi:hypothetical protein [Bacillus sp. C30]|uniref:hypothetical protein n=1 Tax=Bacillus sp. C30 TaxID=1387733 RepID=UPI00349F67F5